MKNFQNSSQRPAVPDELTLTPVHPIVGKAKYRPDYQMDISLHNLLPDSLCHVDMNESDVEKLNDAIRYADADVFLRLLEQHKSKESVKKFITMAVAHLRNFASSCSTMYKTFMDLINAIIEINPDFATIPYNKGILEVIVFNLLHTIAKKGQWKNAANMVAKFCDWDSLVSSQLLQVFPYTITHMGRYIYLARILVNGENFQYAYEILQCPTLCLLESPEKWPYPCHAERDLEFRNKVLTDFFENGYHHNFHVVLDMYRKIFLYGGVFGFDAENSFKTMMINLIEKGKITELNYLIEDIHKLSEHMDDYVFRSYTAVMSTHLPLTISTRLYEMCCERRIHPSFQGTETVITLYCNTMDEEIYLILLAYFRKAMTSSLPPADVTIKVAIPNSYPPHPENIKLVRCVKDINIVIRNILKDKFNIVVKDEHPDCAAWILVKANQIMGYRLNLG